MSGFIPEEKIEEIRIASDIYEVISGYMALSKTGKNYKGLCPFHQEKTPSFVVSTEKQMFHCFGCGLGGNVFSFLMKHENISFPESVLFLARRYGIQIKVPHGIEGEKFVEKKELLYKVNDLAYKFFKRALRETPEGKKALEYLKKRDISDDLVENFGIGYTLPDWDLLVKYLEKNRFSKEVLVESGLAILRENKSGLYDRFRSRIIFPIFDTRGRIMGFGGRNLDKSLPKYINSPETLIYKKGENLYGLHIAREKIKSEGYCIITEGYIDVITAHKFGFVNCVASLGTALTEKQLRIIKGLTEKIIFVYDSDKAGINAVIRAWEGVLKTGLSGKVVVLPEGEDPDSFLRSKGGEAFNSLVKNSRDIGEYVIDRSIEGYNLNTISDRSQALTKVINILEPVLCLIKFADYSSYMVSKLGIKDELLYDAIKYDKKKDITSIPFKEEALKSKLDSLETHLVQLMLVSKEMAVKILDNISPDDFEEPLFKKIVSEIASLRKGKEDFEPNMVLNRLNDEKTTGLISTVLLNDEYLEDIEKAGSDCIKGMQKRRIQKMLSIIENELKSAQMKGNENILNELLEKKYKLYASLKDTKILEN